MIYIYDILLNFFDQGICYEFFEWMEEDVLEHIKKIPLLRISSAMMKDLYHQDIRVEKEFLKRIKNKTESFYKNSSEVITYASLLSDGKKAIALIFDKDGNILEKSNLLLDEEEEVLEMTEELVVTNISYELKKEYKKREDLTRRARKNKAYLLSELKKIKEEKEKINYLCEEFFEEVIDENQKYIKLKEMIEEGNHEKEENLKEFFQTLSHKKV